MRIVRRLSPNGILQVRRGVSLTEVLIAMFVLALGMMGILALFPIGAAQMAQAVKDERTAQLADISEAHFRTLWRNAWLDANGQLDSDTNVFGKEPAYIALDNPAPAYYTPTVNMATLLADTKTVQPTSSVSSYPIYIDPIGYNQQPSQSWAYSYSGTNFLARRSIVSVTGAANPLTAPLRLFSLMDDMSFNTTGLAPNPTVVQRAGRYNAAFLLQRPKNNVRHEVNLKVVVYQNRPIDIALLESPFHQTSGAASIANPTAGSDTIQIPVALNIPALRKGSWLMLTNDFLPSAALPTSEAFADFYRVVGSTRSGGILTLSVSPAVRSHSSGAISAYATVLDGVVEVFDRGNITPFEVPAH